MSPSLDEFPLIYHQHLICVADRAQPVGDYETRPTLEQFLQRTLDQSFRTRPGSEYEDWQVLHVRWPTTGVGLGSSLNHALPAQFDTLEAVFR